MVVGQGEFVIILILALFLFGPKKLPELARSLGHAVAEYHKAVREFKNETYKIEKELTSRPAISTNSTTNSTTSSTTSSTKNGAKEKNKK